METSKVYLESIKKQMLYYKTIAEKAMEQVDEEQLFVTFNSDSNSIAIIAKHMAGNMLSRWTNFLTTDGEKEWRERDAEFENTISNQKELLEQWNKGWNCFFEAIHALQPEDLTKIVYIRNEGHSVTDAINRQLCHYLYHVGQIVFCAKMLKNKEWESLSIPKNKSLDYNSDKFSVEKSIKNFTEAELKRLK